MSPRAEAIGAYQSRFGQSPAGLVRSPGRVNLIGDHTDYNGGLALPMAIDLATWIAYAPSGGLVVEVYSTSERDAVTFTLAEDDRKTGWASYVQGTVREMAGRTAFRAAISSDIPIGAGLSSSASLELGLAKVTTEIDGSPWDPMAAALAGQRAENDWVGVATGLLDQISVSHAVSGHALLIDFASLEISPVAIPEGVAVVLLDGGAQRSLATSEYGERRETCERAARLLGVSSLREISVGDLETIDLPEVERRRVRHVVTENDRVRSFVVALVESDPATAGEIMNTSHASLRDDYEVAGQAQDAVVAAALRSPGVFGARMTGGGFAGTAVALVERSALQSFVEATHRAYRAATGTAPSLHVATAVAGVSVEPLEAAARSDSLIGTAAL